MAFEIRGTNTADRKDLNALSVAESRQALAGLKMHLRPDSNGNIKSGVLKLMHTTDTTKSMAFERKSWYQLYAKRDAKMQQTADQIKLLLDRAGASPSLKSEFEKYASDNHNRIRTEGLVNIIEKLESEQLSERSHSTSEAALASLGSAAGGDTKETGGFGEVKRFILTDKTYGLPTDQQYILKIPKQQAFDEIDRGRNEIFNSEQVHGNPSMMASAPNARRMSLRQEQVNPFVSAYQIWNKAADFFPNDAIKSDFTRGTLNRTYKYTDGTNILQKGSDQPLSDVEDSGEWMSARLDKKPIDGVAYNELFIIERSPADGGNNDFVTLRAGGLKAWLQSQPKDTQVRLHGTIQRFGGEDLSKKALSFQDTGKAAGSALNALANLIERGYEHNDIKPANMAFNGETVTLIDPGQMFKLSKNDSHSYDRNVVGLGTPIYYPQGEVRRTAINAQKTYLSGGRSDVQAMVTSLKEVILRTLGVRNAYGKVHQPDRKEGVGEDGVTYDKYLTNLINEELADSEISDLGKYKKLMGCLEELKRFAQSDPEKSYNHADRLALASQVRSTQQAIENIYPPRR